MESEGEGEEGCDEVGDEEEAHDGEDVIETHCDDVEESVGHCVLLGGGDNIICLWEVDRRLE